MACHDRSMAIHGIYLLCVILIHSTIAALQADHPLYSVIHTNKRNDKNSDQVLARGDRAYIGGTNFFLIIPFTAEGGVGDVKRVSFESTPSNQEKCLQFSPDDHCENTVRVIELMQDGTVLLCGTNSIGPKCFYYDTANSTFRDANLDANRWLTKSPTGSTTSLYMGNNDTDSYLYLGSAKNEAKTGVFTRRLPDSLTTDKSWLDAPEFLGTYALGRDRGRVYTFFNEKSTKFVADGFSATNRKNNYYSMVARVCKNDGGGSWYKDMWMTFTKARLLCPWSGEDLDSSANLYYSELVATYSTEDWVYGIFKTMRNWNLTSYALCKFGADDIDAVMEGRHFSDNQTRFFNSKAPGNAATFEGEGEAFVPGKCPASSNYDLKSNFEQFVLENTLVKMNVLPEGGKAFFVGSSEETFKYILVETFPWCTVIYLLTESGTMAKLKVAQDSSVEVLFKEKLSSNDLGITSAKLMKYGFILATTESEVIRLPVQSCSNYQDCFSCNHDPHCHWHETKSKPVFACRVANVAKQRICAATPETPHSLSTKATSEDNVQITWKHATASSIVSVRTKKEKEMVFSRKVHKNQITVDRSVLEDGRAYEVVIQSVNKTSLSAESSAEFSTSLQKPKLSHHVDDGFVEMKWSQVPGAARYFLKLQNSSKGILQEFTFSAEQDNLYFYLSHLTPSKPYTVTVTATSEDDVVSVGVKEFSGPAAKKSEPLQQTSEAASSCGAFISALIVCVVLLLGALLLILHNNCIIRPNISVLRNEDGCSYKRHHLLIWSRETKRKTQIKCDDTVVSSTSA